MSYAPWAGGVTAAAPPVQPAGADPDMLFQWVDAPRYGAQVAPQQQLYMQAPPPAPYFQQVGAQVPQHFDPRFATGQGMDTGFTAPTYPLFEQPGAWRGAPGARGAGPGGGARGTRGQEDSRGGGRARAEKGAGRQSGGEAAAGGGGGGGGRRAPEPTPEAQAQALTESMGTEDLRKTLVNILESLYEDRIKPLATYVKGRLKERSMPEPLVKCFVELYAKHPDLFIVQKPAASAQQSEEATILFVKEKEPDWFKGWIDIDASDDPYDEAIWDEFAKFLDGEHTFAGGRYGMARELTQRKLAFLEPLSLGEVCHMVQLAIQHRKLIVYHRKMLKPIQSVLGQVSPSNANGASADGECVQDMDDLCTVLFQLLARHPQGIRLCRMKQMIKHELNRKLSEMAFQCTKLIELFGREPLSATFILDTENDGKSIYVRLGDPETFNDHVKGLYAKAGTAEQQPSQAAPPAS